MAHLLAGENLLTFFPVLHDLITDRRGKNLKDFYFSGKKSSKQQQKKGVSNSAENWLSCSTVIKWYQYAANLRKDSKVC